VAGLLAGPSLVRSAEAQSIAPESAFLNRTPTGAGIETGFTASQIDPGNGTDFGGEKALLGRTEGLRIWEPGLLSTAVTSAADAPPLDGERALLGRWPVSQPHRPGSWAQRAVSVEAGGS
jgi:hypothetical protein